MTNEIWKQIKDFPNYEISNLGRIKRIKIGPNTFVGKILKQYKDKGGYYYIIIRNNGKSTFCGVGRLVLKTFSSDILNNLKLECNHRDGVKTNNLIDNLEWVTSSENNKHAFKLGLVSNQREKNPNHKLKEGEICLIKRLYNAKLERGKMYDIKTYGGKISRKFISKMFKITPEQISNIGRGVSWTLGDIK